MIVCYISNITYGDGHCRLYHEGWYYYDGGQLYGPYDTEAQAFEAYEDSCKVMDRIGV